MSRHPPSSRRTRGWPSPRFRRERCQTTPPERGLSVLPPGGARLTTGPRGHHWSSLEPEAPNPGICPHLSAASTRRSPTWTSSATSRRTPPSALMIARCRHTRKTPNAPTTEWGKVTIDGSITAGDQPLETIKRACRMILVKAEHHRPGDRIRTHVQDIPAAAAEQEREAVSSRSCSSRAAGRRGPLDG